MKKYTIETKVGIFVMIGIMCITYMTVKLGNVSFLGENTYPLLARFSNVSGLRVGSTVNMFGIEIGQVDELSMDQKDQLALVEIGVLKGIQIYGDAIASIKTEGLIGDKYISIDPGGSEPPLKPGDTIIETQAAVDIVDLVGKYAFGEIKGGENTSEIK
ncbi:MAG: outer membrane lipid asymmetry maintenance protein MlaD [Desulfobacterales bacterium]|nr:outer membrane lipid asymmetry maintenance protein MlaD [Desulfobacterales bacterium]MDD4071501.1 outer membrane lipid asymmetry maintenance protein MlaD [Desulfobacterales bacterium]MDD4392942.1 outer membrane lipid asymmetry maintenance protein MlaD [Desulfobacterales bacterium]